MPATENSPLYLIWQTISEASLREAISADQAQLCEAWRSYDNFADWARANGYQNGLYLERSDAELPYSAGNCHWTKITSGGLAPPKMVSAFGETKSMNAWARDSRCSVSLATLINRLSEGWEAAEAITTPSSRPPRQITAFGITKSLIEWLADPRCLVDRTALHGRLNTGWNPEEALSTPLRKSMQFIIKAWGEKKRDQDWLADPRCVVGRTILKQRLARKWKAEAALSTPVNDPFGEQQLTAFGETKSILGWLEDERCQVNRIQLQHRVRRNWEAERAISTPPVEKIRHQSGYTISTIPVGAKFGRLLVMGSYTRVKFPSGTYGYLYPCLCSCGTVKENINASNLFSGDITSCGCRKREKRS